MLKHLKRCINMDWTTDENDDLVNLDFIEHIYLVDRGPDYPKPLVVIANSSECEYILKRFERMSDARDFLDTLYSDLSRIGE